MQARLEEDRRPGEVRWKLPGRDLGGLKRFAWGGFFIAAGLFVFAIIWAFPHVDEVREGLKEPDFMLFFHLLFLIPTVVVAWMGFRVLASTFAVMGNRLWTEVRLKDGQLLVWEHFGGWNPKRSFEADEGRSLVLTNDPDVIKPGWTSRRSRAPVRALPVPKEQTYTLLIRTATRSFNVAAMYDQHLLFELGNHLARQLPTIRRVELPDQEPRKESTEQTGVQTEHVPVPELPSDSRIVQQPTARGAGFAVPAFGLRKGSYGLFPLGLIWTAFSCVFVTLVVRDLLKKDLGEVWVPALFLGLSVVFGLVLMLIGVRMGTRKVMIAAGKGGCHVETRTVFGVKTFEWRTGEIRRIYQGPTGTLVNGVPVNALYIEPVEGKVKAFLTQLSGEEQLWMVDRLRRELGMYEE
jgi:hypothetical protein